MFRLYWQKSKSHVTHPPSKDDRHTATMKWRSCVTVEDYSTASLIIILSPSNSVFLKKVILRTCIHIAHVIFVQMDSEYTKNGEHLQIIKTVIKRNMRTERNKINISEYTKKTKAE